MISGRNVSHGAGAGWYLLKSVSSDDDMPTVKPGSVSDAEDYASYVEHPLFGRAPRITGVEPPIASAPGGELWTWTFPPEDRIPFTGIWARPELQKVTSFPIRCYFDQKRHCRDCGRPYIWFAEEQRHWFEALGFYLGTDCVRCVHCRQRRKGRPAKATEDSKLSEQEAQSRRTRQHMDDGTSFPK